MSERELLERITYNPKIFGGRAIIRGHRLAVSHVLGMLADGATAEEIVSAYDWLELDDVKACLLYASHVVDSDRIEPVLANQ
ncbi:MAG TPA: DUF433 domain-containing protein [Thermoanaerobaculia bacterium]|jgi:uncharacterized protein (DUF433 family)